MSHRTLFSFGGVLVAVTVLIAGAYSLRRELSYFFLLKPHASFEEIEPLAPPDYALPENWAALPDRVDNADVLPATDVRDVQDDAPADTFFIHPTTYLSNDGWNQPLDDHAANRIVDRAVLSNQASVFNSCCRVYAPRYRQATLYSFMTHGVDGDKALDLAYEDVKRAFEFYLNHYNAGRPIILASHSQGSFHALRLLEDMFAGNPLRERLVAAYVIGMPIPTDKFVRTIVDIPLCGSLLQTGCLISWNTVGPNPDLPRGLEALRVHYRGGYESNEGKPIACVNPLTWTSDESYGERALNLGGFVFLEEDDAAPPPDVGIVDAQCVDGWLKVTPPEKEAYNETMMGRDSYHIYDYHLFHMNIRENAQIRVAAYLRQTTRTDE